MEEQEEEQEDRRPTRNVGVGVGVGVRCSETTIISQIRRREQLIMILSVVTEQHTGELKKKNV